MKVLMTADTVGGVWSYAVTLCRALERHGVQVALATMGAPLSSAQRGEIRRCRAVTVHESEFRLEWMPDPWADVDAAGEWLLSVARSEAPDVVHLNGYVHADLPWPAPVLVVAHSCVLSWWQAVHGTAAPGEWERYRGAVTAGLRAASAVAAPTRAMLEALEEQYGGVADARVVANGCEPLALPTGHRDPFGRYARLAALPEPMVFAAGRVWDEAKNFGTLAAAAPYMEWPAYLAGSNAGPAGQQQELPGVNCLGVLPTGAMASWHRRASVFAHPALYEPFGLAPLEAALSGTALVLGDIPSLREIWGDAATYVPPRDAAALAGAVNRLAADPTLLRERAEAARQRGIQFTARRMARAYLDLYAELTQRRREPSPEVLACAS